ncbi:hypothetical protein BOX15_Mlig019466g1, partial [Macrostomum lignano]
PLINPSAYNSMPPKPPAAELNYDCLPPEWSDDEAVYPLFHAFKRPRAVDPDSFDRKMKFWSRLLLAFCRRNRIAALSADDLRRLFRRKFPSVGRDYEPECLGAVLYQMLLDQRGRHFKSTDENDWLLDPADETQKQQGLAGKVTGAAYDWLLRRPIAYAWGTFVSGSTAAEMPASLPDRHELVHAGVLRSLIGEVLSGLQQAQAADHDSAGHETDPASPPHRFAPSLNVCRKRDFDRYLESLCPHQPTRRLLVQRLMSDRLLHSRTVQVGRAGSEELLVWARSADCPLTDESAISADVATANSILHLVHTIKTLESEEQQLKLRISAGRDECKRLLRDGRKDKALVVMRRTKATETLLDERKQQLMNLDRMLIQVQMANSNKQVLDAFKVTRDWFKTSQAAEADSHEAAHEALGEIRDVLDEQRELADALAYSPGAEGLDDSELESELDKLLLEEAEQPDSAAGNSTKRKKPAAADAELDAKFSELDVDSLQLPDVSDLPLPHSPNVSLDELKKRLQAL